MIDYNNDDFLLDSIGKDVLLLFIIILFGLYFHVADLSHHMVLFIGLKDEVIDDWIISLLPVQAAVSGIGIAIMALLSGLNKESFFGISVTEYVTSLKPGIFKHRYLMVTAIILIIVNFLFISFHYYNLAIYIFGINVVIIAWLVWDIFFIFSNKFRIQEEIQKFLLERLSNCQFKGSKEILQYFSKEFFEAKSVGNTTLMVQDFTFLNDLYNKIIELKINKDDFEFWHEVYFLACQNMLLLKRSDTSILVINSITKIYNSDNSRFGHSQYPIHIWEDLKGKNVFKYFEDMKLEQMLDLYMELKRALLKDTYYLKEIPSDRNRELKYFSYLFYLYAMRKNTDDIAMFKRIVREILGFNDLWDDNLTNGNIQYFLEKDLNNFTRILIDFKEDILLNDMWNEYISDHTNYAKTPKKLELQYIFSIQSYLYYIALVENLVDDSRREYAKNLLIASKSSWLEYIRNTFNFNSDLLTSELVESIKNQVGNWEVFELEKAKTIIAPEAVEDFFFFHILFKSNNFSKFILILKRGNIQAIWAQYGNGNRFDHLKQSFKDWQNIFLNKWQQVDDIELDRMLRETQSILRRMQMNFLEKAIPKVKFDYFNLQQEIKCRLNKKIESLNNDEYNCDIKEKDFPFSILEYDRTYLEGNKLKELIQSYIFDLLERNCFSVLKGQIQFTELNESDEDIAEKVLNELSKYPSGNTIIGFPESFWVSDESNQKYKKYLEKYTKKIKLRNGNQYIVIVDSSKMLMRVSNFLIEVYDLTEEEINKSFTEENGFWHYQFLGTKTLLNDEEKIEMIRFIKKYYCKLRIVMTIEYGFKDNAGKMIYFKI